MKNKNFKLITDDLKVLGAVLTRNSGPVRSPCVLNEKYSDDNSAKELVDIMPTYGCMNKSFGLNWYISIVRINTNNDGVKKFNKTARAQESNLGMDVTMKHTIPTSPAHVKNHLKEINGIYPFSMPVEDNLIGAIVQIFNTTEFPIIVNERNKGTRIYNSLFNVNPKYSTLKNKIIITHAKLYTCLYQESATMDKYSRKPVEYAKHLSQAYANSINTHVNKVYADTYEFLATIYDIYENNRAFDYDESPLFRAMNKDEPNCNSMYVISRLNISANDLLTNSSLYLRALDMTVAKMSDGISIANMISPEDVDKVYIGSDKDKSLSINLKLTDSENKLPNPMYLPLLDEIIPIERSTSVDDDGLRLQIKYNNSRNVSTVKNIALEEIAKGKYVYDNQEHAKQGADKLTVIKHETEVIKHESEKTKAEGLQVATQQKQIIAEQQLDMERKKHKQDIEKMMYERDIQTRKYAYDLEYSRRQTQQFEKETNLINAKNVFATVGAVSTSAAAIYALVKLYNGQKK